MTFFKSMSFVCLADCWRFACHLIILIIVMFEPFLNASLRAKALNVFIWFSVFSAWASTLNCFGDHLFVDNQRIAKGDLITTANFYVYWDHVEVQGDRQSFDEVSQPTQVVTTGVYPNFSIFYLGGGINGDVSGCTGAGRGLLAMTVFSFLFLLVLLPLTTCRILGVGATEMNKYIGDINAVLRIEFTLAVIVTFLEFLAIAIFGWGCYSQFQNVYGASLTGTGFGFLIAVFLFMIISSTCLYYMRQYGWLQVGVGAREDGLSGAQSNPELRMGLSDGDDYNASADVESAFSYNPNTDTHTLAGSQAKSSDSMDGETPTSNGI